MNCNLNDILFVVAREYNITPDRIKERTRVIAVARPRQIVWWIARNVTKLSLNYLGERMGDFDHSTVMYAVEIVDARMAKDPAFEQKVRGLAQAAVARGAVRATHYANAPVVIPDEQVAA